jgi:hypothetical protein
VIWKTFGWSFVFTAAAFVAALMYGGAAGVITVLLLSLLEISLSFDNAVVNAKVLEKMNAFWQRMFLTVGFAIAVLGMRLLFPVLLVSVTAGLAPGDVISLALAKGDPHTPGTYGYLLNEAHPAIASFGAVFLAMVFFHFLFAERDIVWLRWLERPAARIGRIESIPAVAGLAMMLGVALAVPAEEQATVLIAGVAGILTFLLVNGFASLFEADEDAVIASAGKAGLALFLYINVLDASFSFDGVLGAFALTSDPILIMIGLGVGAIYVRSLTVLLVRKGTLAEYVYLEHGAHMAIGALAAMMLISLFTPVSETVTGLIGMLFIAAALVSSIIEKRRQLKG